MSCPAHLPELLGTGVALRHSDPSSPCHVSLVTPQAEAAGSALSTRDWWRVVSSDLPRTKETTALLLAPNPRASAQSARVSFSPLLREFSCGLREGQPIGLDERSLLEAYTGPLPPPR